MLCEPILNLSLKDPLLNGRNSVCLGQERSAAEDETCAGIGLQTSRRNLFVRFQSQSCGQCTGKVRKPQGDSSVAMTVAVSAAGRRARQTLPQLVQ